MGFVVNHNKCPRCGRTIYLPSAKRGALCADCQAEDLYRSPRHPLLWVILAAAAIAGIIVFLYARSYN